MEVGKNDFYDKLSEKLYYEAEKKLKNLSQAHSSRVMIELGTFNIAQSYVTSKIENRHGDVVNVNIEGGRCGIELQETLFDLKGKNLSHAYLITDVKQDLTGSGSACLKLTVIVQAVLHGASNITQLQRFLSDAFQSWELKTGC